MTSPFTSRVGGILSADIAVPEHERELRFYARVLSTGDDPFWREDLMNNHGMPIIGLGERTPDYADLPLQWMPHIQVADVGKSVAQALERGGREVLHGKDEEGNSQWAVVLDPNGAAFGLIPLVPAEALPSPDDVPTDGRGVGRIAWLDLTVPDASATRDFYRSVVGWSSEDVAMKDGDDHYADYSMLASDGEAAAGVCHARGVNQGLPPVWLMYLPVGDLAESLRRAEEEGGKILRTIDGSDGHAMYAVVQDPVGVCFALASE